MPAPRACGGLKTAAPQRPKLPTSAEMTLGTTNTFGSSNLHVLLCIVQTILSADKYARLVTTSDLSGIYHYESASKLIIGDRIAQAVKALLAAAPA